MLKNAYLLAKIGADTAENERNFAENFAKNWQLPYGASASSRGSSTASRSGGYAAARIGLLDPPPPEPAFLSQR